jgi:hypothetical protein
MGREEFYQKILSSDEFKILSKLANDEAGATVGDALEQVVNLSMSALAIHGPDSNMGASYVDYKVSLALFELAQSLEPSQHHQLVEFVAQLQKRTAIDPATGKPVVTDKSVLWTDMPSMGYVELETYVEYGGNPRDSK